MIYRGVSKHVYFSCEDLDKEEEFDIDIPISENFDDIKAYLFEKKFDVAYNDLSWQLEDGAKEFMHDLEDKWLHDEIDTFTLYHNQDFLDFLSKRTLDVNCVDDEVEDAYREFTSECEFDCRYNLSKEELKELINDTWGSIDIYASIDNEPQSFIKDTIDLEEIYDEEYGEEDEEEEED